ncbi:hypothetical protein BG011_009828 [Mortierella polycephala]|uniref:Septation initiation network scaffold protein cdc11 n=1 Tax=Mortierella polycephala TaxID=41804 RepID=A0A9P6PKK9_9FUNG|nr:hypothetical protein BG011_009828 [Mortierella polycephala]
MLRAAVPSQSAHERQSAPGKRSLPLSLSSSTGSSPSSTSSTKEQRQQQLQRLQQQQRQQQELFKEQKLQQMDRYRKGIQGSSGVSLRMSSASLRNEQGYERQKNQGQDQEQEQGQEQGLGQGPEMLWASQETNDTWINVKDQVQDNVKSMRRQSCVSDRLLNISPVEPLADQSQPHMDHSWSLDDLEDDQGQQLQDQPTATTTATKRFNEQTDSNIDQKNNEHFNDHNKISININSNTLNKNEKSTHGYVHMGKSGPSARSPPRKKDLVEHPQNTEQGINGPLRSRSRSIALESNQRRKDSWSDVEARKSSHGMGVISTKNGSPNRPWRNSNLDDIFSNVADEHTEQTKQAEDHGNDDSSSSLNSYGDIMDALNNSHDSMDMTASRRSKYERAKKLLAEQPSSLHKDAQDHPKSLTSTAGMTLTGRPLAMNQEAFIHQRQAVINACMMIDPSDDRSHAPSFATGKHNVTPNLTTKPASGTSSRLHSNIPSSARSSRFSFGYRHRPQGSKDTEIGDRGSTTSRDSVYRDSLSGSTLGSAGFPAQLEGISKHEMANVFAALKTGAIAELIAHTDSARHIHPKRNIASNATRILPSNMNAKVRRSQGSQQEEDTLAFPSPTAVDLIFDQESAATPKSGGDSNSQQRARGRFNPESDPTCAQQYAALANNGLPKQTSAFVEELANGTNTALRSTTDGSFNNASLPNSRASGRVTLATDREEHGAENMDDDEDEAINDMDDLGSLAGSHGIENAFKSLDMSFDISYRAANRSEAWDKRRQSDHKGVGEHLSQVLLPSKPKRRGEHSLKWEDQVDTTSNADISRVSRKDSLRDEGSSEAFKIALGYLRRHVNDLYPYDDWEQIKSLDLSKRGLESTAHLDQLVEAVEILTLNENKISYLTGVPISVKTLQARSNLLMDLTNFAHLINLQYLDISHNGISDLTGLSSLAHLRELIAEGNCIKSVSALQQMDGLIRLDVSHNCLTSLDFRWSKLQRLEYLNVSYNKIEQLENLESLAGLIHANLAHNCVEDVRLVQPLRRLRILRLSKNKLATFDAMSFPGLRTLYLDDNRLQLLENCQTLTRLENFSARDQELDGLVIDMTEFMNSRKLYLSGNPIRTLDFQMQFFHLEYLEICSGCLKELPLNFAALFPNLRGLNLSDNELKSIEPLSGLLRLRRLILVGNLLKKFGEVHSLLKRLPSLNPLTSNMYPAMSVSTSQGSASRYKDTYRANQNSEAEQDWRRRDIGFRRALTDAMYLKRSVYRAQIVKSCKRLEWFDGDAIQQRERERVPLVLRDLVNGYGRDYLMNNRREDEEEEDYDGAHEYRYDEYECGANDHVYAQEDDYYCQDEMAHEQPHGETSSNRTVTQKQMRQQQQQQLHDHVEPDQHNQVEENQEQVEGASDKQKAIRNWRDGVNEAASQREQQQQHQKPRSPRVRASIMSGSSASGAPAALGTTRSRSQQQKRHIQDMKSGSSRGGSIRSGSQDTSAGPEISTAAVANNSNENRIPPVFVAPTSVHRRISNGLKFNIPLPPTTPRSASTSLLPPRRPSIHTRGRSDGTASAMMIHRQAVHPYPYQNRPRSQQQRSSTYLNGTASGFDGASSMHQLQHPSMSPLGMTASGTIFKSTNLRRRSLGVHGNGVGTNPGLSPAVSAPSHFGLIHHPQPHQGMHLSPLFGTSRSTPAAVSGGGGKSLPNTPSKGGRASRISLHAQGSHHCPQTLARDMERSVIVD